MAFYKNTYSPGYTTNDTYGNFYDEKKVSLITVPERLKNYDLDVRKMHTPTSGSEYGDFLRSDDPYGLRDFQPQNSKPELQIQQPLSQPPSHRLPPPPPERSQYEQQQQNLYEQQQQSLYEQQQQQSLYEQQQQQSLYEQQQQQSLYEQQQQQSLYEQQQQQKNIYDQQLHYRQDETTADDDLSRQPPPPVPEETFRQTGRTEAQQTYRLPRSRSPPPPPDLGMYKSHMDLYTGRSVHRASDESVRPLEPLRKEEVQGIPDAESLPPLRYGSKEIRLPDIEAVELHMRDKSKVLLNVREFYSKYLRD